MASDVAGRAGVKLGLVLLAWLAAVGAGFRQFMDYEVTPGPAGPSPTSWPTDSTISRVAGVPNVLMGVHPRCPCTAASLEVLAEIVRRSPAVASVRLLVYRPSVPTPGWEESWEVLASIPGVGLVDDPGGLEAGRFGLATSGATVAFDAEGRKRFVGGLTASRGGLEMSPGGGSVLEILGGEGPACVESKVFGCPIHAPGAGPREGGTS